jgi:two-component system chemotaxis response regulator CheY
VTAVLSEPHLTVLLIDDSSDVRAFFEVVADLHQIPLITAVDGKDGLEKLSTMAGDPAVVFVDLNMPNMDGRQFLEQMRSLGLASSSHVVVCSGGDQRDAGTSSVATEWLQKPFEMGRIVEIMSRAFRTECAT